MERFVKGSVAVVTGAAGGIGRAIAVSIADSGIAVACVDRAGTNLQAVTEMCEGRGVSAVALAVDVRDRSDLRAAVESASQLGTVRYAVNCAGIDALMPSAHMDEKTWQDVLDINLGGIFNSCVAEYRAMRPAGGSIVNVASISGRIYNQGAQPHAGYSSSKAGVAQLSKVLAVEWVAEGVRVNSVSPGYTRTEMTNRNPAALNADLCSHVPMKRMAEVEEIAGPVEFLLSETASYVTGIDLAIDGGLSSW